MSDQNRLVLQMPHHQVTVSSKPQVYPCSTNNCPEMIRLPEDGVLIAWLDAKTGKSQSWKNACRLSHDSDLAAHQAATARL